MARDISAIQTYLNGQYGLEPLILVKIDWPTEPKIYAKRQIDNFQIDPWLVSVGALVSDQSAKSFVQIQSTDIVLRDVDQQLRELIETYNIEGRTCSIYQAYAGIANGDEILLLDGKIQGPISWNEGDRTLSFTCITRESNVEVGKELTAEVTSSQPFISLKNRIPDLDGIFPPIILGSVVNLPALRITRQLEGSLNSILRVHKPGDLNTSSYVDIFSPNANETLFQYQDPALVTSINSNGIVIDVSYSQRVDELGNADANGNVYRYTITNANPSKYLQIILTANRVSDDPDYNDPKVMWVENPAYRLEGNMVAIKYRAGTVEEPIRLFNRCTKQIGSKCWFEEPWTKVVTVPNNTGYDFIRAQHNIGGGYEILDVRPFKPQTSFGDFYHNFAAVSDETVFVSEEGSTVRYWDRSLQFGLQPEIYIIAQNDITLTSVKAPISGQGFPLEIPYSTNSTISRYTEIANWSSLNLHVINLKIPMSEYGEGWNDSIIVNARSATGINIVDGVSNPTQPWGNISGIIRYLIENTPGHNYLVDDSSFTDVATKVEDYPAGFAVTSATELFALIGSIAYLARVAVILEGNIIKLRYLSEIPSDADFDLDESKIEEQSINLTLTESAACITKLTYTIRESYNTDQIQKIITNNLGLIGKFESSIDYFIYNRTICADVSAKYLLNQKSQIWRQLRVTLPLDGLALQLFDIVELDLTGELSNFTTINANSVFCRVIGFQYDIENESVQVVLELPVKFGENTIDNGYWEVESISRPLNPCSKYLRRWYILPYQRALVEPHRAYQHDDVNMSSRFGPDNTLIPADNTESPTVTEPSQYLQTLDVMAYNTETGKFHPKNLGEITGSGGGGIPVVANIFQTGWGVTGG